MTTLFGRIILFSSTSCLLLLLFIRRSTGFTTTTSCEDPSVLNFHQVLERVGKTVLRPGGSRASSKLYQWANNSLSSDSFVIELAAGLGRSSQQLAQLYGCRVLMTDTDDARLSRGMERVQQLGLATRIQSRNLNMFELGDLGEQVFDCALTEASLTHFSHDKKIDFFSGISKHTKQFLLHEICFQTTDPEQHTAIRREMPQVLRIGFNPETIDSWKDLLENAGFTVDQVETGPIAVLDPLSVIQDEGGIGFCRIAWNLITQPLLRARVLKTRSMLQSYKKDLGYIIMQASKPYQP